MEDCQFRDGPKEETGYEPAPYFPHFPDKIIDDRCPDCKGRKSDPRAIQRAAMKETPLERSKRQRDRQRAREQGKRGKGSSSGGRGKGKA